MGGGSQTFMSVMIIGAGVRNLYIRLIRGVAKYTRQILSILQGGHGLSGSLEKGKRALAHPVIHFYLPWS